MLAILAANLAFRVMPRVGGLEGWRVKGFEGLGSQQF
ncbi:MAG: hypothetical protein ACJAXN_000540 [Psychromonas sp.]|jgi:hypothetical protein